MRYVHLDKKIGSVNLEPVQPLTNGETFVTTVGELKSRQILPSMNIVV